MRSPNPQVTPELCSKANSAIRKDYQYLFPVPSLNKKLKSHLNHQIDPSNCTQQSSGVQDTALETVTVSKLRLLPMQQPRNLFATNERETKIKAFLK